MKFIISKGNQSLSVQNETFVVEIADCTGGYLYPPGGSDKVFEMNPVPPQGGYTAGTKSILHNPPGGCTQVRYPPGGYPGQVPPGGVYLQDLVKAQII